jgi:nicotinate-nucleotide pyrophosphorylase (carboxylating)
MNLDYDIREEIFRHELERQFTGVLIAESGGVLSGIERCRKLIESLDLAFSTELSDGHIVEDEQSIACVVGNPIQIAMAEEQIIGTLSKSSGIATAAHQAQLKIGTQIQVVSGGWKKMPFEIKDLIRQAAHDGGIGIRMLESPFIYLDKNYVRILGGVEQSIQKVRSLNRSIVLQIRGETKPITEEATDAVQTGASVVMIDTGNIDHLLEVTGRLRTLGLRDKVRVAFAGNISFKDIGKLVNMDVDIVDIGYCILDAPCLPMRFDVIQRI